MCVPKYAFTKVKTGSFFCCSCCILSGVQFLNCITIGIYIFEFSQDHVTKNQPVAVPV